MTVETLPRVRADAVETVPTKLLEAGDARMDTGTASETGQRRSEGGGDRARTSRWQAVSAIALLPNAARPRHTPTP